MSYQRLSTHFIYYLVNVEQLYCNKLLLKDNKWQQYFGQVKVLDDESIKGKRNIVVSMKVVFIFINVVHIFPLVFNAELRLYMKLGTGTQQTSSRCDQYAG